MTVEQTALIDSIRQDPVTGICTLGILDDLSWDDAHLQLLQAKLNHYLRYIESGEIYIEYPQVQGLDFAIELLCIYAPGSHANLFLETAADILHDAGYTLQVGPLGSDYADETFVSL